MIKKVLSFSFLIWHFSNICYAQEKIIASDDLKRLFGCWQGTLTYLDYSTNMPFSMEAKLVIKPIDKSSNLQIEITYPKEPEANSIDTIVVEDNGSIIDGGVIKSKKLNGGNYVELVTEQNGQDGNDNKPATFRNTYLINEMHYSKKKEVQFDGSSVWITRQEYKFRRCKEE